MTVQDDGYCWPSYYEEYGRYPAPDVSLRPVPIRCGIISADGDPDSECHIAIGINNEEPAVLTPQSARRLGKLLHDAIGEHDIDIRQKQAKRATAVQHLLDGALLTRTQWRSLMASLTSNEPAERETAINTLKTCAPPTWSNTPTP